MLYEASFPWMVNRGIFMTPGDEEQWTLSVQHTDADVDRYIDAFREPKHVHLDYVMERKGYWYPYADRR